MIQSNIIFMFIHIFLFTTTTPSTVLDRIKWNRPPPPPTPRKRSHAIAKTRHFPILDAYLKHAATFTIDWKRRTTSSLHLPVICELAVHLFRGGRDRWIGLIKKKKPILTVNSLSVLPHDAIEWGMMVKSEKEECSNELGITLTINKKIRKFQRR